MVDIHTVVSVFSQIIGWTYFLAWSVSFYPQVIENWQRKSVVGLSFDFLFLNFLGHSSYCVFNSTLYFSKTVQGMWFQKYHSEVPVELNDVVFSIHAVLLTAITIFQTFIYERGQQTVSWFARILIVGSLAVITIFLAYAITDSWPGVLDWILFFNMLGYIKIMCSFVKYCPQAIMNCRRRMTVGWSIYNILLDLTGGFLSIMQMFLDSMNYGDWSKFRNIPKLLLGNLTLGFDFIFIVQHYCLYRKNNRAYWEEQQGKNADVKEQDGTPVSHQEDTTSINIPQQDENEKTPLNKIEQ